MIVGDGAVRCGEGARPRANPIPAFLYISSAPPETYYSSPETLTGQTESTAIDAVSVHQQREAGRPQAQGFGPAGEGEHR